MPSLLDQLLHQIAYPPPAPPVPSPDIPGFEPFPAGYEYGGNSGSWDPRNLYRIGRQMGADNLGVYTSWLPEGLQRLALRMYSPPSHAIGWPYPGFADQAYGTTGVQPATPSPLANWALWGWGLTPDQPRQDPFTLLQQMQGAAPPSPMPPDDPGGWAR